MNDVDGCPQPYIQNKTTWIRQCWFACFFFFPPALADIYGSCLSDFPSVLKQRCVFFFDTVSTIV